MTALVRDLRSAVRQLTRNPGFATAAVLILALGIGLDAAVFSVVNALLFRPLPVSAPDELTAVYSASPGDFMAASALTTADFEDLRERSQGLGAVVAYTYSPMVVEHAGEHRLVLGVRATPDFFSMLGVRPFLGRFFPPEGAADTQQAVLGYAAWQRRFGADPGIVGSTIRLNGRPCTVIGVAPEAFFGLTRGVSPEVWVPLFLRDVDRADRRQRELGWLWAIGRRDRGVTLAQVRSELRSLASQLAAEHPETNAGRTLVAFPANEVRILPGVDARLGTASAVVLGVVGLVLLIACSNVANLLLARALARRREIAIRRALGAGTAAVVRQLLIESFLLALLGALLGLGLARASNAALARLRLPLPVDFTLGLALDGRVLLFTLAAATLTALVFGLAPAVAAARSDLSALLREGSPVAGSRMQKRLGGLLVAGQMALCLVLLIDTGLAIRSLRNAHRVDPGFEPRGVVVATFAPVLQGYGRAEADQLLRRLTDRVRALPGVESAGLASHLPLTIEISFDRAAAAGTTAPPERWPSVDSAFVGPGYFETLRIPVLRGRAFADADEEGAPAVTIVNQAFAARFWPGTDAVGRRLRIAGAGTDYRVVGVVRDGKYRTLGESPRPFLYRALAQRGLRTAGHTGEITSGSETLVARSSGPAPVALAEVRQVIREVDPHLAVARLEPLETTLGVALFLPRVAAVLFAVLGVLGLLLASLGIYSLMVYMVRQRHREIGIRVALGATRRDVLRLVLRRGLTLAAAGIGVGLVLAAATTRFLSAVLYGISPTDAATFMAVPAFLLIVALTATYLPARRAAGVDAMTALRDD